MSTSVGPQTMLAMARACRDDGPKLTDGVAEGRVQGPWDELQRTPESVPPPAWHADVLRAREAQIRKGQSSFEGWADAKRRIRASTR